MLKAAAVALAVLTLSVTASAQNTEGADHTDLYYTPQQETPEDYTKGAVRLGDMPGQDLVRPLGGDGVPLGEFKPSRPANATANVLQPPLSHLRTSRQTVGIDRDPDTGLPLDTYSTRRRGFGDVAQTAAELEQSEAAALSAPDPH